MLYQITDGTVSAGGTQILSHIDFEIKGTEKIAVVGKNGAGKTTLLRLIAGEISLDRDDKREGTGFFLSRRVTIGMLSQSTVSFAERELTVEELFMSYGPAEEDFSRERFLEEAEFDRIFTGFGFEKAEKKRRFSSFSGGEQTKIALIRLLLMKPDILLLDEPTNHLDMPCVEWLEEYLKNYEKAAVFVSHDRFFLDRTADVVYELSRGRLTRYPGNYTHYREQKRKNYALQIKRYERQEKEQKRLEELVERFKHKPNKAGFARAKKTILQRLEQVEKPEKDEARIFTGEIIPAVPGSKWVFEAKHLKIGYDCELLELSLRIRRGQKIGIIGNNGAGKTTFLKTAAGQLRPLGGKCFLGNQITLGYFDQHSAELESNKSVLKHFHDLFPGLTEKEARSRLGAYLFGGREAGKTVSSLSGGEKSRLVLAEILESRPNFLLLDEPTNHMDIQAKETLESAFRAYKGTILFISHDRYFIRQVADSLLIFDGQSAMYYPFGYEHYFEHSRKQQGGSMAARVQAEEQALIAGLRAVPRAERHQLREMDTEEAYVDWKLRLAEEKMHAAGREVEHLLEEKEQARERQMIEWFEAYTGRGRKQKESEGRAEEGEMPAENAETSMLEDAWKRWTDSCLEWFEDYCESSEPRR